MRLYLDTAPVIYVVEQVLPFFPMVDARLSASGMVLVASDLTRMECRIKPVREEKTDLLKDYGFLLVCGKRNGAIRTGKPERIQGVLRKVHNSNSQVSPTKSWPKL